MLLKRIHIKNFRSIREVSLTVGTQMAIVGGNGTGKSTILRALDRFYGTSTVVELDDFFARQVNEPIEIGLSFINFSADETETFASRIHNGEMTVVRVFEASGGKSNGRYYGATLQHTGFSGIRNTDGGTAVRAAYNKVREAGGVYSDLPSVTRADQIPGMLASWEASHTDQCELGRDDGQFFGFTNVAKGALQKSTSFVFIPAVRDASADALDARGAVIQRLLELVVRSAIQRRSDIQGFQARISQEYRELTDPSRLQELSGLSGELTDTLKQFYREASVALRWKPTEDFAVPLPNADVLLNDDGFEGPVDRKGHGLQRAFILTLLQHLAKATSADVARQSEEAKEPLSEGAAGQKGETGEVALSASAAERTTQEPPSYSIPGLILAIEEPELYQHPTKQRHFAKVLSQLSSGQLPGVARQTQVLFATHSSLFVSMDRFDEVRLARRRREEHTGHKECCLTYSDLDAVARRLERAFQRAEGTYTGEGLKARLHIIDAEIAEGLFADMVVLVEGVSDRAALVAAAALEGSDLEALGIAVLAVDGKTKMDRPAAIFSSLGIPTYLVWDCDQKESTVEGVEHNRALQRIAGAAADALFDAKTYVGSTYACFQSKLETTLRAEVGTAVYEAELNAVKTKYGIERNDDAEKAPFAMREMLTNVAKQGHKSATVGSIIRAITDLRRNAADADEAEREAITKKQEAA